MSGKCLVAHVKLSEFRVEIVSSKQRHFSPNLRHKINIDIGCRNLWLLMLISQLSYNFAPRIDNDRMTIASSFLIVRACLSSCYHV